MRTLRIDHVTVVSPDAPRAAATFERLFGLAPAARTDVAAEGASATAALTIGDARLDFVTPAPETPLADALRSNGEGIAALTLMVDDIDDTARALTHAQVPHTAQTFAGRRVLAVEPRAAHGVRLRLMARD